MGARGARRGLAAAVVVAVLGGAPAGGAEQPERQPPARPVVTFCEELADDGDVLSPYPFDDVRDDDAHRFTIACLRELAITDGQRPRAFEPSAPVTRGQMATFVARLVTITRPLPVDPDDAYADDEGDVHEPSIDALAAVGVFADPVHGPFRPGEPVTREDTAGWIARGLAYALGIGLEWAPAPFDDVAGSPEVDAIEQLYWTGVVTGTTAATFEPTAVVSRAQMASFLVRAAELSVSYGAPAVLPSMVRIVWLGPRDAPLDEARPGLGRELAAVEAWVGRETGGRGLRLVDGDGWVEVGLPGTRAEYDADPARFASDRDAAVAASDEVAGAGTGRYVDVWVSPVAVPVEASGGCASADLALLRTEVHVGRCAPGRLAAAPTTLADSLFAQVVAHQVFHLLGAVPACAPHHVPGGHVGDAADDLLGPSSAAGVDRRLDAGHDDYFGHERFDCWDVDRHPALTAPR